MNDEARNHYLERMCAMFFKFRESNVLCDTTLITTDGDLPAHSIVLAAASSVFRDAFKTSGCEDSGSYQLELPGIGGALAESLLSLIYTGSSSSSVKDETSQTVLAEMCHQLGINFCSTTDTCVVDEPSNSCNDVDESGYHPFMNLSSDLSECPGTTDEVDPSEVLNKVAGEQPDMESALLGFGDDVVMELCSDGLESEEIVRIIAANNSIAAFPFVCDICLQRFDNGLSLRSHRRQHHGCVECVHCGLSFESQVKLCQHLSKYCSCIVIKCNVCSMELTGREALVKHAETNHICNMICSTCCQPFLDAESFNMHDAMHLLSREYTYQCTCGQHRTSKHQFEDHVSNSHSDIETPSALFYCCVCGQTFKSKTMISTHLVSHGLVVPNSQVHVSNGVNEWLPTAHTCQDCGKSCTHASSLKIHRRSHSGERPFVCDICGQSFKENCLRKHMLVHQTESRPFACNNCPMTFTRISDLQAHSRRHTGEMGFTCTECGRQFRKKNTLQRHMRVHTGERPYVCETCGKSFKIMFHLQLHRSIHLTERSFHCSVCGKAFQNAVRLKKHTVVHSGVKPYSCPICSRPFNRNANMRAHMRIHETKRSLSSLVVGTGFDMCGVSTSTDERLSTYSCGECGLSFARMSSLKAHVRSHDVTLSVADDYQQQQDGNCVINDVLHDGMSSGVELIYCKVEDQSDSFVTLPVAVQFSDDESNVQYIC